MVRKGSHTASLPIYRKLLTEYMHWRFLKKEPSFIFFKKLLTNQNNHDKIYLLAGNAVNTGKTVMATGVAGRTDVKLNRRRRESEVMKQ